MTDTKNKRLDPIAMKTVLAITREIKVEIPWQAGDVMLVDNRLVQHARNSYNGDRRVLAGLVYERIVEEMVEVEDEVMVE